MSSFVSKKVTVANQNGFTLVELITVIVIVAIVAVMGSSFVVSTANIYNEVQERSRLIAHGRLAVEQMTRQLRQSVPNSVRVSGSGACVEFMPLIEGATYTTLLPALGNTVPATSSIPTIQFALDASNENEANILVSPLSAAEVYATGSPAARVDAGGFGAGTSFTSVPLAGNHQFLRNSLSNRVFIAESPRRFCITGTSLVEYSSYGLITAGLNDANPGGSSAIIASEIDGGSSNFVLSNSSQDRNSALFINLALLQDGGATIPLNQEVVIRNVP